MIELCIAAGDLKTLRAKLLASPNEQCAVLFASRAVRTDGLARMLVRFFELPSKNDYSSQGVDHAELTPNFVARVTKRSRIENLSLIFVHTHPGTQPPIFSLIDKQGEQMLSAFLAHRTPNMTHAAIVLSKGGMSARILATDEYVRVVSVGNKRIVESEPNDDVYVNSQQFDRQIRAFGTEGQRCLQELRVAIVGLGGTGSILAQQLVHLGIRDFILVDPDIIECTNLNRVVGATPSDVDKPKVDIAKRYINSFNANSQVRDIVGDVVHVSVASNLADADVIFGCTDSHGSRSMLQQISYQYLIPCIDMGSTITTDHGHVTGVFGRVQLLGPGNACLWCSNLLNSEEVRRDMMNKFERKLDPYIEDAHEPTPSVISLNGTVVSLAVTMLLGLVTSAPVDARHIIYNASTASLRSVRSEAQEGCYICSRDGVLARGDSQQISGRQD